MENKNKKTTVWQICRDVVLFSILILQLGQLLLPYRPQISCVIDPIYISPLKLTNGADTTVCHIGVANGIYYILPYSFKIDSISYENSSEECFYPSSHLSDSIKMITPNINYPIMSDKYDKHEFSLVFLFDLLYTENNIKCAFRNNSKIATIYSSFKYKHGLFERKNTQLIPVYIQYDK